MCKCIVTIGLVENFLLPKKQALQLVDLFTQSHCIINKYSREDGTQYEVHDAPRVRLENVDQKELIYPVDAEGEA